ncbi:type II toxin-antitoxin system VapC family toxin [Halomarina oriensis]|uniref:PIN domain-containing protein n=1 Tax=Halomarina oriensis TaxID=671145 RepID=A0A6B0GI43_9EURY|nr:PIN domain-containing protein [Halomarina oriensis]
MTEFLLDTSVLVDLIYEDEQAVRGHADIAGDAATTTTSVYELAKFFEEAPELLARKTVFDLSPADAAEAGRLYRELHDRGALLSEVDTLIAGSALNRNLTLVTRDDDFERVSALDLELF